MTAARPMKLPISMWSARTRCVAPPSSRRPSIVSRFEPMPWIWQPIACSSSHSSCTWGSQAAFTIVVVPSASAAAISAFSVPVTEASSRNSSAPCRPPGAQNL